MHPESNNSLGKINKEGRKPGFQTEAAGKCYSFMISLLGAILHGL